MVLAGQTWENGEDGDWKGARNEKVGCCGDGYDSGRCNGGMLLGRHGVLEVAEKILKWKRQKMDI